MTNKKHTNKQPQIFIVGGSIRDILLNRIPKDIDRVVVGATSATMRDMGFSSTVGVDFPVFLDKNGDEWALARTERKSGKGYHGFETISDSKCLNPHLLQIFIDNGFNPNETYDINVLIKEFQRINQ